jgi:hypothetical protein
MIRAYFILNYSIRLAYSSLIIAQLIFLIIKNRTNKYFILFSVYGLLDLVYVIISILITELFLVISGDS